MSRQQSFDNERDFKLDIEDYSGRNFDTDAIDTIVEKSHDGTFVPQTNSDDILDEEHWATDSFDDFHVDKEY